MAEQITAHTPDIIAPPECAEGCKGLAEQVRLASHASLENPDRQFAVVCEKARRLGCNAVVFQMGFYNQEGDQETLMAPFVSKVDKNGRRARDVIEDAKEAGAIEVPFNQFKDNIL